MFAKLAIDAQDVVDPHVRLQTLLCMVLFLLATSKIAAAHTCMLMASTAVSQLGLRAQSSSGTSSSRPSAHSQREMLRAGLFLDTYICDLLGFQSTLQPVLAEMTPIDKVTQVRANGTQIIENEQRRLEAVALVLNLELLSILPEAGLFETVSGEPLDAAKWLREGRETKLANIYLAEKQIERWNVRFLAVFPQGEVVPQIAR